MRRSKKGLDVEVEEELEEEGEADAEADEEAGVEDRSRRSYFWPPHVGQPVP